MQFICLPTQLKFIVFSEKIKGRRRAKDALLEFRSLNSCSSFLIRTSNDRSLDYSRHGGPLWFVSQYINGTSCHFITPSKRGAVNVGDSVVRASSPCRQPTTYSMLFDCVFPFMIRDRVVWLGGDMGWKPLPRNHAALSAVARSRSQYWKSCREDNSG